MKKEKTGWQNLRRELIEAWKKVDYKQGIEYYKINLELAEKVTLLKEKRCKNEKGKMKHTGNKK